MSIHWVTHDYNIIKDSSAYFWKLEDLWIYALCCIILFCANWNCGIRGQNEAKRVRKFRILSIHCFPQGLRVLRNHYSTTNMAVRVSTRLLRVSSLEPTSPAYYLLFCSSGLSYRGTFSSSRIILDILLSPFTTLFITPRENDIDIWLVYLSMIS